MLRVAMMVVVMVGSFSVVTASAQTAPPPNSGTRASVAVEADVLAYGLPGYSGVINVSLPNKLQFAFGMGRYEVPSFLLKGDANYDAVHWKATATSLQVARATYRFRGPMKNGPAIGAIVLNQNWRLRAEKLSGESRFRLVNAGITAGYYQHIGKHFYLYPTFAFTHNSVQSGVAGLKGTPYHVARFGPNGSLHGGFEWGRR